MAPHTDNRLRIADQKAQGVLDAGPNGPRCVRMKIGAETAQSSLDQDCGGHAVAYSEYVQGGVVRYVIVYRGVSGQQAQTLLATRDASWPHAC